MVYGPEYATKTEKGVPRQLNWEKQETAHLNPTRWENQVRENLNLPVRVSQGMSAWV